MKKILDLDHESTFIIAHILTFEFAISIIHLAGISRTNIITSFCSLKRYLE